LLKLELSTRAVVVELVGQMVVALPFNIQLEEMAALAL
jgi:hypothetical protein